MGKIYPPHFSQGMSSQVMSGRVVSGQGRVFKVTGLVGARFGLSRRVKSGRGFKLTVSSHV